MRLRHYNILLFLLMLLAGCANRGIGPQGGPKDSIPPKVLREEPENGAVNYTGKTVTIHFNEYIQLDNVSQHLLICPPQKQQPDIKQVGKMVKLTFQDPLLDSTTYSIDFGSAICDFHEKNPLKNYFIAFSTGPEIDSLEVFGHLYNAEDLNPVSGVIVGLQSNLHDSAFTTLPLTRISRTNEQGQFGIHNIKRGTYRLYGLGDISSDYMLQPGESLAWADSLVTPVMEIDSLGNVYVGPNDLTLFYFRDSKVQRRFMRARREEANRIMLVFSAPQDSMPRLQGLDSVSMDDIYVQTSQNLDTLTLWLRDSILISRDTLRFVMDYYRTDSLYQLEPATDTILASYRAPNLTPKVQAAKQREAAARRLELRSNGRQKMDVFDTLTVTAVMPIERIEQDSIHLCLRVDSTWRNIPYSIQLNDSAHMSFQLIFQLQKGAEYELRVDSNAVWDICGKSNREKRFPMSIKTDNDYATLTVRMAHYDPQMRLQLLNEQDKVLRDVPAREATVLQYLAPTSYYLRMYFDLNGDGLWTTGSWEQHRQPEPVYYFPAKLTLKANWEFEETFDYTATPQAESKPAEIRKDAGAKK